MDMTQNELNTVLESHMKWLRGEEGGERAGLYYADLCGANLNGANLSSSDLSDASLNGANLRGSDLSGANLRNANLGDACLYGADLRNADLSNADLGDADLRSANLSGANLRNANLGDACLYGADLRNADLSFADLSDACLSGADLSGADLRNADLSFADFSHCAYVITATLGSYAVVAYNGCSGFRVTAGPIRSLTLAEALAHWSPENKLRWTVQTDEYGERMTRIVQFLAAEARLLGWQVDDESEKS